MKYIGCTIYYAHDKVPSAREARKMSAADQRQLGGDAAHSFVESYLPAPRHREHLRQMAVR